MSHNNLRVTNITKLIGEQQHRKVDVKVMHIALTFNSSRKKI